VTIMSEIQLDWTRKRLMENILRRENATIYDKFMVYFIQAQVFRASALKRRQVSSNGEYNAVCPW